MKLPTRQDINVHDSLEERSACEHFLGKTLEQAEALFRENSLYYQEDLIFMGAAAFRFYVQAAVNYIRSDSATGDSDIVSCFASILEHRLEFDEEELHPIADRLASICRYIIQHSERFALTSEIYGDIRPRFLCFEQRFTEMERQ